MIAVSTIIPKISMSVRRKPEALKALGKEYAEKELLLNQRVADCYFISTLKSIMNGLNLSADKSGNQKLNAREWLKGFTIKDTKNKLAEVFFPYSRKKVVISTREACSRDDFDYVSSVYLSEGNKKVLPLEFAYGILRKVQDERTKDAKNISDAISIGWSTLVMRDLGLKPVQLSNAYAITEQDLANYRKYTGKLFKQFEKKPENLSVVLSTKANIITDFLDDGHSYSLKRVVNDGLIINNPHNKTAEEKITFEQFYEYFASVEFARLRPERLFKDMKEAKESIAKLPPEVTTFTEDVFKIPSKIKPIRNSKEATIKGGVYMVFNDELLK